MQAQFQGQPAVKAEKRFELRGWWNELTSVYS